MTQTKRKKSHTKHTFSKNQQKKKNQKKKLKNYQLKPIIRSRSFETVPFYFLLGQDFSQIPVHLGVYFRVNFLASFVFTLSLYAMGEWYTISLSWSLSPASGVFFFSIIIFVVLFLFCCTKITNKTLNDWKQWKRMGQHATNSKCSCLCLRCDITVSIE